MKALPSSNPSPRRRKGGKIVFLIFKQGSRVPEYGPQHLRGKVVQTAFRVLLRELVSPMAPRARAQRIGSPSRSSTPPNCARPRSPSEHENAHCWETLMPFPKFSVMQCRGDGAPLRLSRRRAPAVLRQSHRHTESVVVLLGGARLGHRRRLFSPVRSPR